MNEWPAVAGKKKTPGYSCKQISFYWTTENGPNEYDLKLYILDIYLRKDVDIQYTEGATGNI